MCFVDPRPPLEGPQNTPVALSSKQEVNMTFCGPARDTVLTNRQTGKLNFDTCYIIIITYLLRPRKQCVLWTRDRCWRGHKTHCFPEVSVNKCFVI